MNFLFLHLILTSITADVPKVTKANVGLTQKKSSIISITEEEKIHVTHYDMSKYSGDTLIDMKKVKPAFEEWINKSDYKF